LSGLKAKDISQKLNNRPIKTIERQMNQLIKFGLVERKGSRKTGGYYLTGKMKGRMKSGNGIML
jgi:predicted transcriptional regulator